MTFGWRRKMAAAAARDKVAATVRVREEDREQPYLDTALATHMGTRSTQQDAVFVSEPLYENGIAVAVLCDGMGGMAAGEKISADAVEFLATRLLSLPPGANLPQSYEKMLRDANEMILARYVQAGCEGGTTAVTVFVQNKTLYWASVGDSRIYLLRGGELARLTRDHNYALCLQQLVQAGRLRQEEANADPRREALVSYLGAPVLELLDVSRAPLALQPDDVVLLCSDGLTKSLSDDRIRALLHPINATLYETAHRLAVTAFDEGTGAQDNTSVILLRYLGNAGKTSFPAESLRQATTV